MEIKNGQLGFKDSTGVMCWFSLDVVKAAVSGKYANIAHCWSIVGEHALEHLWVGASMRCSNDSVVLTFEGESSSITVAQLAELETGQ